MIRSSKSTRRYQPRSRRNKIIEHEWEIAIARTAPSHIAVKHRDSLLEIRPLGHHASRKMPVLEPAAWEEPFLAAYQKCGVLQAAADEVGVHYEAIRRRRKESESFNQAVRDAHVSAVARLEKEAFRRAEANSDGLVMFLLKAFKPELYAQERYLPDVSKMSDAEIELLIIGARAGREGTPEGAP